MVGICPGADFYHGLQHLTDAAFLSSRQSDTGNRSLVITALSLALLAVIAARVLTQFEGNALTILYVMAAAITVSSASISLVRRLIWRRRRGRIYRDEEDGEDRE